MSGASDAARRLAKELGRVEIDGFIVHETVTPERVQEAVERYAASLDNPGFCLACGADAEGVEPDATRYTCEVCEAPAVYGASELLIHMAEV